MDTAHTTICGWKDPSNETMLPPEDVLLYTRLRNGTWALLPGSQVRAIRPLRHPRLHPTLDLVYIELEDCLLPHTTLHGGGFTPLPLPWAHHVDGPPHPGPPLPQREEYPPPQGGSSTVSEIGRVLSPPCLFGSTALDMIDADLGEDS
jgi:hypothetical protein